MHDHIGSPFERILQGWRTKGGIHDELSSDSVNFVGVVLDTSGFSCWIQRGFQPAYISFFEFIVDANNGETFASSFLIHLNGLLETWITTRDRQAFRMSPRKSLLAPMNNTPDVHECYAPHNWLPIQMDK